jgi:serine/threonine protein kinase
MQDYSRHYLGNYYLRKRIAAGKFTISYSAEDSQHPNLLTITVFPTCPSNIEQLQFLKRAEAICKLHHPNIRVIHDFDVHKGIPFIVTTSSPLPTIQHCYPPGVRLDKQVILKYNHECASALQYAHDHQVVHGNLSDEAIRIDLRNTHLQIDFSLALLNLPLYAQSVKQQADYAAYMAPEQFSNRLLPASDQYAMGILIYQMLSGNRPFQGSSDEIKQQQLSVPPPSLGRKVANISPYLEEVIEIALAKDPTGRFKSIHAFRTALESAIDYQPTSLPSENTFRIPQRPYWIDGMEEQMGHINTNPLKERDPEELPEPIRQMLPSAGALQHPRKRRSLRSILQSFFAQLRRTSGLF